MIDRNIRGYPPQRNTNAIKEDNSLLMACALR